MARATTTDRMASAEEVRRHANELRALADELGVAPVRVRNDGTLVVHADQPGYTQALDASARATTLVGTYVHVITDDVPGAADVQDL